jgi:hypothetical protein
MLLEIESTLMIDEVKNRLLAIILMDMISEPKLSSQYGGADSNNEGPPPARAPQSPEQKREVQRILEAQQLAWQQKRTLRAPRELNRRSARAVLAGTKDPLAADTGGPHEKKAKKAMKKKSESLKAEVRQNMMDEEAREGEEDESERLRALLRGQQPGVLPSGVAGPQPPGLAEPLRAQAAVLGAQIAAAWKGQPGAREQLAKDARNAEAAGKEAKKWLKQHRNAWERDPGEADMWILDMAFGWIAKPLGAVVNAAQAAIADPKAVAAPGAAAVVGIAAAPAAVQAVAPAAAGIAGWIERAAANPGMLAWAPLLPGLYDATLVLNLLWIPTRYYYPQIRAAAEQKLFEREILYTADEEKWSEAHLGRTPPRVKEVIRQRLDLLEKREHHELWAQIRDLKVKVELARRKAEPPVGVPSKQNKNNYDAINKELVKLYKPITNLQLGYWNPAEHLDDSGNPISNIDKPSEYNMSPLERVNRLQKKHQARRQDELFAKLPWLRRNSDPTSMQKFNSEVSNETAIIRAKRIKKAETQKNYRFNNTLEGGPILPHDKNWAPAAPAAAVAPSAVAPSAVAPSAVAPSAAEARKIALRARLGIGNKARKKTARRPANNSNTNSNSSQDGGQREENIDSEIINITIALTAATTHAAIKVSGMSDEQAAIGRLTTYAYLKVMYLLKQTKKDVSPRTLVGGNHRMMGGSKPNEIVSDVLQSILEGNSPSETKTNIVSLVPVKEKQVTAIIANSFTDTFAKLM